MLFFLLGKEERAPCFFSGTVGYVRTLYCCIFTISIGFLLSIESLVDRELVAETLPWFSLSRQESQPRQVQAVGSLVKAAMIQTWVRLSAAPFRQDTLTPGLWWICLARNMSRLLQEGSSRLIRKSVSQQPLKNRSCLSFIVILGLWCRSLVSLTAFSWENELNEEIIGCCFQASSYHSFGTWRDCFNSFYVVGMFAILFTSKWIIGMKVQQLSPAFYNYVF